MAMQTKLIVVVVVTRLFAEAVPKVTEDVLLVKLVGFDDV